MQIADELVGYLEELSRLELTKEEEERAKRELGNVVEYIDTLNELDTESVEPTSHILPVNNVFREDEVTHSFERGAIIGNAPETKNGCFKVPKAVE